ncbi:MAG: hypothetical protein K0U64_01015 [Actinomycetia bacterium]|nr:hypothetical protein [Actinomycetes bacterium]
MPHLIVAELPPRPELAGPACRRPGFVSEGSECVTKSASGYVVSMAFHAQPTAAVMRDE